MATKKKQFNIISETLIQILEGKERVEYHVDSSQAWAEKPTNQTRFVGCKETHKNYIT